MTWKGSWENKITRRRCNNISDFVFDIRAQAV